MYIEELAHGSPFLDLQNFFSQEGVRLGEQTCLFAGVVKCTKWRSWSQLDSPMWTSRAELKTPTTQANHVEIGLCLLRKGLPPFSFNTQWILPATESCFECPCGEEQYPSLNIHVELCWTILALIILFNELSNVRELHYSQSLKLLNFFLPIQQLQHRLPFVEQQTVEWC